MPVNNENPSPEQIINTDFEIPEFPGLAYDPSNDIEEREEAFNNDEVLETAKTFREISEEQELGELKQRINTDNLQESEKTPEEKLTAYLELLSDVSHKGIETILLKDDIPEEVKPSSKTLYKLMQEAHPEELKEIIEGQNDINNKANTIW